MSLDPGHHLAGAERLGDIIISPKAEAPYLVNILLLGGHHNNGGILLLPHLPADLKPIYPRKHQVQDK